MEFKLKITEKVFKNEKGEEIPYFECVANVAGTNIRFSPKPEDKSLLKYLISKVNSSNGVK